MADASAPPAPEKAHISLAAAHGIKARVALSKGDWGTAATSAALARVGSSIMGQADWHAGFNSVELPEVIWGSRIIDTESNLSEKTEKIEPEIELNFQVNDVVKAEERKTMSLEEELQDIVSVDVMADLFENVQPKSINDKFASNIQIGLNDRIAFVKNLFNNQQEDYNRVISQLNTFKSENDAKNFIKKMVKPDYDWSEQEELETRFMEIIERKFA